MNLKGKGKHSVEVHLPNHGAYVCACAHAPSHNLLLVVRAWKAEVEGEQQRGNWGRVMWALMNCATERGLLDSSEALEDLARESREQCSVIGNITHAAAWILEGDMGSEDPEKENSLSLL